MQKYNRTLHLPVSYFLSFFFSSFFLSLFSSFLASFLASFPLFFCFFVLLKNNLLLIPPCFRFRLSLFCLAFVSFMLHCLLLSLCRLFLQFRLYQVKGLQRKFKPVCQALCFLHFSIFPLYQIIQCASFIEMFVLPTPFREKTSTSR